MNRVKCLQPPIFLFYQRGKLEKTFIAGEQNIHVMRKEDHTQDRYRAWVTKKLRPSLVWVYIWLHIGMYQDCNIYRKTRLPRAETQPLLSNFKLGQNMDLTLFPRGASLLCWSKLKIGQQIYFLTQICFPNFFSLGKHTSSSFSPVREVGVWHSVCF
jgi:hypothetical protein